MSVNNTLNCLKKSIAPFLFLFIIPFTSCEEDKICNDTVWYKDADNDGKGDPNETATGCEPPENFVSNGDDIDDSIPCDDPVTWYQDEDGDGMGDPEKPVLFCDQAPEGTVNNDDDDDDSYNCDDEVWYQDFDGDGLGNSSETISTCEKPLGYVANNDDQNDTQGNSNEEELIFYDPSLAYDGYVLLNELNRDAIRLIEKDGTTVSVWPLGEENLIGNDAELLGDGTFLSAHKVENPALSQGGGGGLVEIRGVNKMVTWQYRMNSIDALQHHDVEQLPNGNILIMAWEQRSQQEINSKGYVGSASTLNSESIYEVDPTNDQIVWEWHVWDHLVQDQQMLLPNYGVIHQNPEKIDINYVNDTPEFMHCNGIDYDEKRDLIFISARKYSEIWVIDHNTTSSEAAGSEGDLVYRFGNPDAYDQEGDQLFDYQHQPNFLEDGLPGAGNVLVFSNNPNDIQSSIVEMKLPEDLDFSKQPEVVWSFTHPDLLSRILSGAERLPNGNTLISSGTQGTVWEVTPDNELAWKFKIKTGRLWRSYSYSKGSSATRAIGL